MWVIEHRGDHSRPFHESFRTLEEAERMLVRFAPITSEEFCIVPEDVNSVTPGILRMLRESLMRGDLRGILLPKLSVDQYLPSDPKSDNVVLAWFIKGVPEAVIPVKNYIDHCNGVVDVDYGDSETIPSCSIVYAEMLRDKLNTNHIHTMVKEMARLANLEPTDFTLTFPNTDDKFPYAPEILDQYFKLRTEEDNRKAQEQALSQHTEEEPQQQPGVDLDAEATQLANEALVNRLVGLFN